MDSLLVIGQDQKLCMLLKKLGYGLLEPAPEQPLAELLHKQVVDLILVDSRIDADGEPLLQYLRCEEKTKSVPVVCLVHSEGERRKLEELHDDKLELIGKPHSIGTIASKVATRLRLRKMAGIEEGSATLAEMNAALRDLNARFGQQLDEARSIQESLLPEELPHDDRCEVAVVYKPLEEVGGDWYFVKREKSGCFSAQIADVTGHGLAAAFISAMAKLAMTAANQEMPDQLLAEMNQLMTPQLPSGRFVTMCACLYDPATGLLRFARAGHPPALVLQRQRNEVQSLVGEGFPFGFMAEGEYSPVEVVLEPADVVVLYTDGITEARNRSGAFYGTERFSEVIKKSSPADTAGKIVASILQDFEKFLEGRLLKDDITLVVMRRRK